MLQNHKNIIGRLIHYATQAPSGHNSQPWKFKICGNCINIYPDFDRALPVADPHHRELYISLGCATENLVTAAKALGIQSEVKLLPFNDGEYSIQIWLSDFVSAKKDEHILQVIESRQTNRSVYKNQQLSPNMLNNISRLPREKGVSLHFFQKGTAPFELLKSFALRASVVQMQDQEYKKELINWIRFNPMQVKKTEDGMSYKALGAPAMPPFFGKIVMQTMLNPLKQNKDELKKIDSSSHFLLLTTHENDIPSWIRLGRYLERILIHLTDLGIANAYVNTIAEDFKKVMNLKLQPAMLLRLGFADKMPYSPRRPLTEVMEEKEWEEAESKNY